MIYLLIVLFSPLYAFIYARAYKKDLTSGLLSNSFWCSIGIACFIFLAILFTHLSVGIFNFKWTKDKQKTELYDGFSVTQQDFSKEIVNKKTSDWFGGFITSENVETKTVFIIESDSSTVVIEVEKADKLNVTTK